MGAAKAWTGGSVAGAAIFVASWVLEQATGIVVPMDVQSAGALVVGAVVSAAVYYMPNAKA